MKKTDPIVVIDYKNLGTIALDELKQAIWEDIQMLREEFGVSFITGVKLVVVLVGPTTEVTPPCGLPS